MVKEKDITYRRLPGRNFTRYSLWLAKDHILNLRRRAFSEDYKRFYFQDVQVIITQKTATGKVLNSIWALFAGLFGLAAYRSAGSGAIILWLFSGIFLFGLGINLLLGPTCTCWVMTGVQQSKLSSLSRLRTAERVVGILKRVIQRTQGALNAEKVKFGTQENTYADKERIF